MTSQRQSYAHGPEPGAPTDEMLAQITAFLAERDLYGLIWCDEQLIATHRYGALSNYVPLNTNICQSLPPLMGLDAVIAALRQTPGKPVDIPNVSFRQGEETSPRLNIAVYWLPARKQFLVVLGRVLRRLDLEQELIHQIRDKRIAESAVAEKSQLLERVNKELSRANADLEEFAYVIAHDLNAPLRALRYLSQDLERSLGAGKTKAAADQLDQLRWQTRRMGAMLTGLFEYASLGRKLEAVTSVDMGAMIERIISSLPARAGMVINADDDWPVFDTLEQPLDLVLRNLIENAVKHHDRDDGKIKLRAEDTPDAWVFSISDDGPGIAPDYHGAVFEPFLKVDSERNPDSSGVGLALVRKSVESVGGSIELISGGDNGLGSTFKITWPKIIEQ